MVEGSCCSKCEAITGSEEGINALNGEDGYHHYGWSEMRSSSRQGCGICQTVVKRVETHYSEIIDSLEEQTDGNARAQIIVRPKWDLSNDKLGLEENKDPFNGRLLNKLCFHLETSPTPIEVSLDVETVFGDPASQFVTGKTESKEFTEEVSLNLRRSVIDCLTEHNIDDCPGKSTNQLPRRILDVGAVVDGRVAEGPIKLKEPREGEKAIYATLSYCWGGLQLMTVKSNLASHLQELPPLEELPKTFADAILVTRHLGLQYLWIDALCIIQDDEIDKLEQIEAMSEIYRNAIVTIAATSASGASEGFLHSGKPLHPAGQLPLLINTNNGPGWGTIYLRGDWVSVSVSDEPLYSRAWTFQEAVLSPRVLDFNTYNSVHMCSHEDYPSLFSGHKISGYQWPGQEIFKNVHRLEASKMFQALYFMHPRYFFRSGEFDVDKFGMWRDVIFEYSARRLTFPSDRLPALAGIARRLTPYAGTYLAGFWKDSIVHHLGWEHRSMQNWPQGDYEASDSFHARSSTDNLITPRPSPSWSWVSVPYGVFIAPLLTTAASLAESHVNLVSEQSPYGQIQQATIVLQAKIIEFSDLPFTPIFHRERGRAAFEVDRAVHLDFGELIPDPMPDRVHKNTRLLYIGSRSHYGDAYDTRLVSKPDARTFLVISKTDGEDRYRRIGIFHLKEVDNMVQTSELDVLLDSKELEEVKII